MLRLLPLALAAVLPLLSGTAAAAMWQQPVSIAPQGLVGRATVDADGGTVVPFQSDAGSGVVRAPAGEPFGAPTMLPSARLGEPPRLAPRAGGVTQMAWRSDGGVRVATVTAGGVRERDLLWPFNDRQRPVVAASRDGSAAVVWREFKRPDHLIRVAVRRAGGAFGKPVTVARDTVEKHDPLVAVTPGGSVAVAWSLPSGGSVLVRGGRNGFGAAQPLTGPRDLGRLEGLVADASGGFTAVWFADERRQEAMRTVYVPRGGAAMPPQIHARGELEVGSPDTGLPRPAIAAGPRSVLLTWRAGDVVEVAEVIRGVAVRRESVPAGARGYDVTWSVAGLAVDGGAVVAWEAAGQIFAARRSPGAARFGPPELVAREWPSRVLTAAAGRRGEATVAWTGGNTRLVDLRVGAGVRATRLLSDDVGGDHAPPPMALSDAPGQFITADGYARVRVHSYEAVTARVTARLAQGGRIARVTSSRLSLPAREWRTIRVRLDGAAADMVRRRQVSGLTISITAVGYDAAGNRGYAFG